MTVDAREHERRLLRFHMDGKQAYLDAHHKGLDADLCPVCQQVQEVLMPRPLEDRINMVAGLHGPTHSPGGAVTGYCSECQIQWPCPTYHIAVGWEYHDCEEKGWCEHAGVTMAPDGEQANG